MIWCRGVGVHAVAQALRANLNNYTMFSGFSIATLCINCAINQRCHPGEGRRGTRSLCWRSPGCLQTVHVPWSIVFWNFYFDWVNRVQTENIRSCHARWIILPCASYSVSFSPNLSRFSSTLDFDVVFQCLPRWNLGVSLIRPHASHGRALSMNFTLANAIQPLLVGILSRNHASVTFFTILTLRSIRTAKNIRLPVKAWTGFLTKNQAHGNLYCLFSQNLQQETWIFNSFPCLIVFFGLMPCLPEWYAFSRPSHSLIQREFHLNQLMIHFSC